MKRQTWTRLLLAVLVSATSLTLVGAPSGAAPTDQRSPSASELAGKPIPPPPPTDAVDPAKGPRTTPKPKLDPGATAPTLAPWEVTLHASSQFLWPTQYTTLTATANQDVGPTPFYISIFDANTGTYVAICGSGTTCTVSLTAPVRTDGFYVARVSGWPNGNPPPNLQASSRPVEVKWHDAHVELTSSPSTVLVGGSVTLTASVTRNDWTDPLDVGPSPFWISIYDVATGTRLAVCGTGTSCGVTVSQSTEGTRRYVAYVSQYNAARHPGDLVLRPANLGARP